MMYDWSPPEKKTACALRERSTRHHLLRETDWPALSFIKSRGARELPMPPMVRQFPSARDERNPHV
jgi:hypothetical protein